MEAATMETFLTRTELAKRWKISPATLATWASQGTGPRYALIGRSARYSLSDIIAFETESLGVRSVR